MAITTNINLNLQTPGFPVTVNAVQYDEQSRYIVATLYDGGSPYTIPAGVAAMLRYEKPDGTRGFYDDNITIDGSAITVLLAAQALAVAGTVKAQLNLYDTGGMKLSSFAFFVQVEASTYSDNEIISSDYYSVLTDQIASALAAEEAAAASADEAAAAMGGKMDTVPSATDGHMAIFDAAGQVEDGGPVPAVDVVSVFGRTGAVAAQDGDYTAAQVGAAPAAAGVKPGGTTGQLYAKASDTDFDGGWVDLEDSPAIVAIGGRLDGLDSGKADLDANSKVKAEQTSSLPVETTESKTLWLADAGVGIYCTNAADITITIPINSAVTFPVGTEIEIYRAGAGAVTIAAASGVTIECSDSARTIADQYTSAFLKKWTTDTWSLQGNVG